MKNGRVVAFRIALVAALTLILTALPASAQEQPVKIGLLVPVSGELSIYRPNVERAAALAVSHVNEQGGILGGRPLELVIADDGSNPAIGIQAAQRLIDAEEVAGIVGPVSSAVAIPVATQVTIPNGVVMITLGTSENISHLDDDDFVFRTVASDALQGQVLGTLASRLGYKNIAMIYLDNGYGRGLARRVADGFEMWGGRVALSLPFVDGEASYRSQLARLAGSGAEALVVIAYPGGGIEILRQAVEGGYFEDFLLADGLYFPEVVEAVGDLLDGAWGTVPSSSHMPGSIVIESLYEKRYGPVERSLFLYEAYDAAFLLALAVEKAGTTSPEAVRSALRQLHAMTGEPVMPGEWAKAVRLIREGKAIRYYGSPFPLGFDANGDPRLGSIDIWTVIDGEIRVITSERATLEAPAAFGL